MLCPGEMPTGLYQELHRAWFVFSIFRMFDDSNESGPTEDPQRTSEKEDDNLFENLIPRSVVWLVLVDVVNEHIFGAVVVCLVWGSCFRVFFFQCVCGVFIVRSLFADCHVLLLWLRLLFFPVSLPLFSSLISSCVSVSLYSFSLFSVSHLCLVSLLLLVSLLYFYFFVRPSFIL